MATYSIQAAEIDALLEFPFTDAVSTLTIPLSGATVTMVVTAPAIGNKTPVRTTYTCQISNDGTYASYTTVGTEFVTAGNYSLQAVYVGALGTHHGPVTTLKVLANL